MLALSERTGAFEDGNDRARVGDAGKRHAPIQNAIRKVLSFHSQWLGELDLR